MANRQYIGARYVPKFYEGTNGNEWQPNVSYEALTIVQYLNSSYTSKKLVPSNIGNPANNPNFWALTGNYNGQVQDYMNQVEEYQQSLKNINYKNLTDISNRKFVFIGDSYTQTPTPQTSCVGRCIAMLELTNNQYHNIGINGANMGGFISQVNNYQYGDESSITDVVIIGGMNDCQITFANSQLNNQIPQLLSIIKSKFVNAVIWAGFCGNGYYSNQTLVDQFPGFTYDNVQNIRYLWELNFAKDNKVRYMNNLDRWYRMLGETDFLTGGSGIHPTSYGAQTLAYNIANYLKYAGEAGFDLVANNQLSGSVNLITSYIHRPTGPVMWKYGDTEHIVFAGMEANLSTNIFLSRDTPYNLYELDKTKSNCVINNSKTEIETILCVTKVENNIPEPVMGLFIFTQNIVTLQVRNFVAPTEIKALFVPTLDFMCPANAV